MADNKSTDWTRQPLFGLGLIDCTKEKDTENVGLGVEKLDIKGEESFLGHS